jgi:hypothetical protein
MVFETVMIARMITATATIPRTNGSLAGSGAMCPLLARQIDVTGTLERTRERCVSYFTLRRLSKKCTLWSSRSPIPFRVTTNPSLAPDSLPGLFSLLAVVGGAEASGGFLPPSPPAEKATARQGQARNTCSNNRSWHCSRSSSGGKCVFKKVTSCIQSVGLLLHYELLASEIDATDYRIVGGHWGLSLALLADDAARRVHSCAFIFR